MTWKLNEMPQYKQHKFTRERMWSVEGFHHMHIQILSIFIFFFWSRPDPIMYAYVNNEMSIISGRMKHFLVAAFQKQ